MLEIQRCIKVLKRSDRNSTAHSMRLSAQLRNSLSILRAPALILIAPALIPELQRSVYLLQAALIPDLQRPVLFLQRLFQSSSTQSMELQRSVDMLQRMVMTVVRILPLMQMSTTTTTTATAADLS